MRLHPTEIWFVIFTGIVRNVWYIENQNKELMFFPGIQLLSSNFQQNGFSGLANKG